MLTLPVRIVYAMSLKGCLLGIFPLVTATPSVNVAELTPLPPATRSRLTYPSQLMRVSHMVMDEHQLASIASNQDAITAAQHGPSASTHLTL
jgi:hypothetical protein